MFNVLFFYCVPFTNEQYFGYIGSEPTIQSFVASRIHLLYFEVTNICLNRAESRILSTHVAQYGPMSCFPCYSWTTPPSRELPYLSPECSLSRYVGFGLRNLHLNQGTQMEHKVNWKCTLLCARCSHQSSKVINNPLINNKIQFLHFYA